MIVDIIAIVIIGLLLSLGFIGIISEKQRFNNGRCRYCNHKLELFDYDSGGARGYLCPQCSNHCVWVSYNCVDDKFREENEKGEEKC